MSCFDISSHRIIDSVIAIYLFVCFFRQVVIKMPDSAVVFDDLNNSSVQEKTVSSQYFKPLQVIDLEMK